MTGPIPKRSDQLIRRNIPEVPVQKITAIGTVPVPELDLGVPTHPMVVSFYQSLRDSAQARYFEPSDWEYARLTMYAINEMFDYGSLSAMKLSAVNQMLTNLLVTEGDRRRARLEIERVSNPSGEDGEVLTIADHFANRLGVKK